MADISEVTKIYKLQVVGFDDTVQKFNALDSALNQVKLSMIALKTLLKTGITDPAQIAEVNKRLVELAATEERLTKTMGTGKVAVDNSVSAYLKLTQQYKEARAATEDLTAEFGVDSEQAIKAAEAAAIYKQQLVEINNLIKTAGVLNVPAVSPVAATVTPLAINDIPFTTNLEALKAEQEAVKQTGNVLSEFDLQQQKAAISAKEFGDSQFVAAGKVKESAVAYTTIDSALDQYSGKLRQNLIAQIENTNTLAVNKAQQKEITDAIKASGVATDAQKEKLAALRQEAQILTETNKALSITIRNQVKEFIADAGSIDQMQAQLNQLQQSYEGLSEVERASPFGQQLKAEIDVLEPKVKSLEATLGKFSRNVGNYPTVFTGAFKVLENELDIVRGKLVQGNFGGKELDELIKREATLTAVTENLGKSYTTTTAQANAYKEAVRTIGVSVGTNTEVFQNFSKEVVAGNVQLKESDKALNVTAASGRKFGGVFQTIFSQLRNIANIIPGLGISGIILLLFAPIEAFASKVGDVIGRLFEAKEGVKDFSAQVNESNRILDETGKEYEEAATNVSKLTIDIQLAKNGFLDKQQVLKEYNESIGKTTGQVNTLDEAEKALVKNGPAYIQMMLFKAAATLALQEAAKKAFEAERDNQKELLKVQRIQREGEKAKDVAAGAGGLSEFLGSGIENERKAAVITNKKRVDNLTLIAEKFQKDAAEIAKKNKFDFFGDEAGTKKETKDRVDRLAVEEQNEIKRIETTRLRLIAIENTRTNEIEKVRDLSLEEEVFHLRKIEQINVDALDSKINLFEKKKNLNAEEARSLAEFGEQKSSIELQTSKKIQDLEKKRYDESVSILKTNLDEQVKLIRENDKKIQEEVTLAPSVKLQSKLDADNAILKLQSDYAAALDLLEKQSNANTIRNAKQIAEDIRKVKADILKDELAFTQASIDDIEKEAQRKIAILRLNVSEARLTVLEDPKTKQKKKVTQNETLDKAEDIGTLSIQIEALKNQLPLYKIQLDEGIITQETYLKHQTDLNNKAKALGDKTVEDLKSQTGQIKTVGQLLQSAISEAFGAKPGSKTDQAVGQVVAQSFALAKDAMNAYFDAERDRIEQSKKRAIERAELERDQMLGRAQSRAEEESINRQFEQKKEAAAKDAFEKNKKLKRSEAMISFATEIANIFATVYQLGPIAGPIIGAALAALAAGRLALTISRIDKETYAYGGEVPTRGGRFGGKPHSKGGTHFGYKDQDFEAEVDELAVIRTKNAPKNKTYQISGTHTEIASMLNRLGGGIDFKPGAKLKKLEYGGSLGESLQAPVFTPSIINGGGSAGNEKLLEAITTQNIEMRKQTEAINSRIDRLEVHQVTDTVTNAQRKQVRQTNVATL